MYNIYPTDDQSESASSHDSSSYVIQGQLVNKLLFRKCLGPGQFITILRLVLLENDGTVTEIKTLYQNKAHYIYHKASVGQNYRVDLNDSLTKPDTAYSSAQRETALSSSWWLQKLEGSIQHQQMLRFFTDARNAVTVLKQKKAINIAGTFISYLLGPFACHVYGHPKIRGHFVQLMDEYGYKFFVLIWSRLSLKNGDFDVRECRPGDVLLITSARGPTPAPDGHSCITMSSLFPPVLEPKCVDSKRINHLKNRYSANSDDDSVVYAL